MSQVRTVMAKTGLYYFMHLLDLHKKARRLPVSTDDGIIRGYHEEDSHMCSDGCEEEAVQLFMPWWGCRCLVPDLLLHELELSMEKLGLICDTVYAWDVFSDMMRSQLRCTFPNTNLDWPFTDSHRTILVDWIIQVHEVYNFSDETLYLAVYLINRSLRQIKVSIANLQLLGVVCLFLAAKKEENVLPEVSELCFLMENCYTKRQLLRMERRVLCELNFELSNCPPLHFLLLIASIARCSTKVTWMARYLLELSLLEGQCVVFLPAELAGAALCLARRVLQEPPTPEGETAWCVASSIHVYSEHNLLRIMDILARAAARAQSRESRATFIKFSTAQTMFASNHPALRRGPCLMGLPTTQT